MPPDGGRIAELSERRASEDRGDDMHGMGHHHIDTGKGDFSRDPTGLAMADPIAEVILNDGGELELRIAPVANRIGGETVRKLAYNGSIPGPTLRVKQGSEIVVTVRNEADMPATVHWHGLRLENKYDGVPHDTQKPIAISETLVGGPRLKATLLSSTTHGT